MAFRDPDHKSNKRGTGKRAERSLPPSIVTGKRPRLVGGPALDLERRVTYRFSIISSMVVRAVASMYGPKYGLLPPSWKAMAAIGRYGPMSAKDVCARTTVEPDKVTRAVDRLVALGYVQRTKDKLDGRRVVLKLTPVGRRVYEDIESATRRIELLLLAALSPQERRALDRITTKLQGQVELHIADKGARNRVANRRGTVSVERAGSRTRADARRPRARKRGHSG